MQDKELQNILTLLSLAVLVDRKVYEVEVHALGRQITQLYKTLKTSMFVTEQMAVDWFHSNRADLIAILEGPDKDIYIIQLLTKLSDFPKKFRLYDAILRVAYADAEYHQSENDLVKLASKIWNIDHNTDDATLPSP